MTALLYTKLIKVCVTEPRRYSFLGDFQLMAECIIKIGRETQKLRRSVHPDTKYIEEMESARLLALCVFMGRYEEELKKLIKGLKMDEQYIDEIFENMI